MISKDVFIEEMTDGGKQFILSVLNGGNDLSNDASRWLR